METNCLICSEQERMQRLETKIDKMFDAVTDVRVSLGKLEGTKDKLEQHEQKIQELEKKTRVYDALATRRSVIMAYIISIAALLISALPFLMNLTK